MSNTFPLYIGADHRGFALKEALKPWLLSQGYELADASSPTYDPADDFPPLAFKVAEAIAIDPLVTRGILLCGSGVGVNIAANKVAHVRASIGINPDMVKKGREDDDMNVLVIAADFQSLEDAKKLITAFLNTPFDESERRVRRLQQIHQYEQHR